MAQTQRKRRLGLEAKIRSEVRRQGMSCYRLSKLSGVSEPTIGRFINARKMLTSASMEAVCKALGLVLVHRDELEESA